jgi:hypothetical protein
MAAQIVSYRHVALRQQTADSVTVVASWTARNADSVRVAYANGITRTRGPRGRDSVRVARPSVATNFSLTLTPVRGSVSGTVRTLSIALPVRPQPAPTIDSASVDTATTTVPPAPPTAFTPNLPSGMRLVVDTRFGNMLLNQWNADSLAYIWDGRNATDPTAPWGPNVFETFYPGGSMGNGGGAQVFGPQDNRWRSVYFALAIWFSPNYSTHSNEEKLFIPRMDIDGVESGHRLAIWNKWEPASPEITFKIMPQPAYGEVITDGAPLVKGRWQTVEVYLRTSTGNANDGIIRIWVDGRVSVDRTNIRFSDGGQAYFKGIRLEGTRGGGTSTAPVPPEGQVRRYNRLAFYAGN